MAENVIEFPVVTEFGVAETAETLGILATGFEMVTFWDTVSLCASFLSNAIADQENVPAVS